MAESNNLNLGGVRFEVYSDAAAHDYIHDNGAQMRELGEAAYHRSLMETTGEELAADLAAKLTHREEPMYFADSLANPQVAVERGKLNPGLFANTRLVAAHRSAQGLIGYVVSHDNASGRLATVKMHTPPEINVPIVGGKRYAWHQLEVLDPGNRGQGIAEAMGLLSLAERHPDQPATAYTWPALLPSFVKRLERVGFRQRHTQEGAGPEGADLVRYAAPVKVIMDGIRNRVPQLEQALTALPIERHGH